MAYKIPEVIPPLCNDCKYFINDKFWIIKTYLGRCEFYDEKRHCDNECIAVTRYGYSLTPNKESTKIENNNQKPICPNCNKPQNDNAIFCKDCGTEISPKELVTIAYCEKCESEYDKSYTFCEKEGNKLKIIEIEKGTKNQVTTIKPKIKQMKTNEAITSDTDVELPMKWYKFVTYVMCPLGIIGIIVLILGLSNYVDDIVTFSLLFDSLLIGILMLGLHNKTAWSWKLLLGLYIINSLFGRIEALDEWGPFVYLIFVIIVNAFTTYPNYIYFNKRKHLFVN